MKRPGVDTLPLLALFALLSLGAPVQTITLPVAAGSFVPLAGASGCSPHPALLLWTSSNTLAVQNGPDPGGKPTFALNSHACITGLETYHWNDGQGATPGTISVQQSPPTGPVIGTFPARGTRGQGGAPNVNWVVTITPPLLVPAGVFSVIDSDEPTWSQNPRSAYRGFATVYGFCLPPVSGTGCVAAALMPGAAVLAVKRIDMTTVATGWARTDDRLLSTGDGGVHWTDVTPPGYDSIAGAAVAFQGASAAWLAMPSGAGTTLAVLRTGDGGRTWIRSEIAARTFEQMSFVDARTGWMTVDVDHAAGSEALRLVRTKDGGASWDEIARTDPPGGPVRSGLPLSGVKAGFSFLNGARGWIAGYVPRDNYTYLYATRDGGRTWRHEALPLPPTGAAVEIGLTPPVPFPPRDAVMMARLPLPARTLTLLYVTHDGGRRWTSTSPVPVSASTAAFVSVNRGWITDGTTLYATGDAGHHWTVEPPSAMFQDVTELDFVSPNEGWAVRGGSPSLLKTVDGGRTWVAVR